MDELLIPNAAGCGGLLFSNRSPVDRTEPIDTYWVRVTGQNLDASANVYGGDTQTHPGCLFVKMARQWSGWSGELTWGSLEGELVLRCSHDGLGHVSIQIDLQSGPMPSDWRVTATVMTEAGQLEHIARRAELFFG